LYSKKEETKPSTIPVITAAFKTTSELPKRNAKAKSSVVIKAAVLFVTDKNTKKLPRSLPGAKSLITGLLATMPIPLKKLKPKHASKTQGSAHCAIPAFTKKGMGSITNKLALRATHEDAYTRIMGRWRTNIFPSGNAKKDKKLNAVIKPIVTLPAFKYIAYTTIILPVTSVKEAEFKAEKIPYKRLPAEI